MRHFDSTQNDDDPPHFSIDRECRLLLPTALVQSRIDAQTKADEEKRRLAIEKRQADCEAEEKADREANENAAKNKRPKKADLGSAEYFNETTNRLFAEVPKSMPVQIFDLESTKEAIDLWVNSTDRTDNVRASFDNALRSNGARYIPHLTRAQTCVLPPNSKLSEALLPELDAELKALRVKFPNFAEAIDLIDGELRLFSRQHDSEFRLSPILLKGSPGVGKSYFASKLAEALGVSFEKLSAGGMQGAFSVNGTSPHYKDPMPGQIFFLLSRSLYCSPVVLLDEIDKIAGNIGDPIEPVLLDLLEPETAKSFKDECMMMKFDASHCIFIGTANENISAPLASRFHVIDVPPFTHDQQRDVACQIFGDFCTSLKVEVEADPDLLVQIAGSDLRSFTRSMRFAVGKALREDRNKIEPSDFSLMTNRKQRMGFSY